MFTKLLFFGLTIFSTHSFVSKYLLRPVPQRQGLLTAQSSGGRGNPPRKFSSNLLLDGENQNSNVVVATDPPVVNVLHGGVGIGVLAKLIEQLINGFKARQTFDSSFPTKISVELFVGFTTQVIAEVGKRGSNSLAELDFIIAE
jgi:hypothetical protein